MRRTVLALVMALVAILSPVSQAEASAASGRVKAPSIGMNAPIVKVGMKDGRLNIGDNPRVIYTLRRGDPPCDPIGTTVYEGHAWRAGDGVADRWGELKRGRIITVGGCRFKVTKRVFWPDDRSVKHLYRVGGPARIVLIGCKVDDYGRNTVVFARRV